MAITLVADLEQARAALAARTPAELTNFIPVASADSLIKLAADSSSSSQSGPLAFYAILCHATDLEDPMQSMNISLPEPLKQFVDGQIASGRYSSASEYIRELIREDEKRRAEERLESLLLDGLKGEEAELTREDWSAIRKEARARVAARKKRK
jgi:antitoxin ParD1/3/4